MVDQTEIPEGEDLETKFVEVEGVKYKEDPENEGQPLEEDGKFVPFEEKKKEEKKKDDKEEGEISVTRKSAKEHIIERKEKKIEKLKKKKEGEGDDDEGEELSPEGKMAVGKEVSKQIQPLLKATRQAADEQELTDVLAKYPEAKEMEKELRKYMNKPALKTASVEFIFWGLAAKKRELEGKKKKADEEAKTSETGGHETRKLDEGDIPDITKLSDEKMDKLVTDVLTGRA